MSTPYEPNPGQQPTDAAAPTQFIPSGQVPQTPPQPAFGAPAPNDGAPAGFGAAPAFGAPDPNAQSGAPQYGQAPQFGQQPQYGQAPQQPQFGQAQQGAPAWGQPGSTQPMQNYPDPNANPYANPNGYANPYPMQPAKPKRSGFGALAVGLVGTVIGRVVIFLVVAGGIAIYHFATADPAQRNSNGQVSQSGDLQASDLQVGDCFDAPSADSNISTLKAIPCTQAHDSQVYLEPSLKEASYPGDATVEKEADADCDSDDAEAVISDDAPDSLETTYYVPQDKETFDNGQHFIICVIEDDDTKMTQSYVSSASSAS